MKTNASSTEQLLDLTQKMFECATAGDWDQLSSLEKSRLPLFKQIFTGGISGNVELAREVLSIDEKTQKLAEAQMPILQQEILMMKKSGKANNAYQAIQDSAAGSD